MSIYANVDPRDGSVNKGLEPLANFSCGLMMGLGERDHGD
jgi:hypothetical protein